MTLIKTAITGTKDYHEFMRQVVFEHVPKKAMQDVQHANLDEFNNEKFIIVLPVELIHLHKHRSGKEMLCWLIFRDNRLLKYAVEMFKTIELAEQDAKQQWQWLIEDTSNLPSAMPTSVRFLLRNKKPIENG